jgi:multidrug resistance efflux pump
MKPRDARIRIEELEQRLDLAQREIENLERENAQLRAQLECYEPWRQLRQAPARAA